MRVETHVLDTKTCIHCDKTKELSSFVKNKTQPSGYRNICKDCHKTNELARRHKDFDKTRESDRKKNLQKSYGLSVEKYDEILSTQKGCCAICGTHQMKLKKTLFVDHCHTTGKVRGLLCHNCNTILGHAKDREDILKNAIKYLQVNY